MPCRPGHPHIPTLGLVAAVILCMAWADLRAEMPVDNTGSPAILYLVNSDANAPGFIAVTDGMTCCEPNLVIVTHGWYEKSGTGRAGWRWPSPNAWIANTPVFCRADGVAYGFTRTREGGPSQWKTSLMIETTNSPIRIHNHGQGLP